jgi:hypothetical protein
MMKLLPLLWSRPSIIDFRGPGDADWHLASIATSSSSVIWLRIVTSVAGARAPATDTMVRFR